MLTTLPGAYPSSSTHHPPRRTDSLSSNYAKPKPTTPLVQAREDAKFARVVLNAPHSALSEDDELGEEEGEQRKNERQRELVEMLARMTGWVEELTTSLQHAYKDQSDLETALTLTRSNLQLALANNEMLEDALKRAGGSGKDVGWRRWSEREDMRLSSSVRDLSTNLHDGHSPSPSPSPSPSSAQPSSQGSRFFKFSSLMSNVPSNTSPTEAQSGSVQPFASAASSAAASRSSSPVPPIMGPTQRERELKAQLDKERKTLRELAVSKAELENELESLSQALFEEANNMVALANRKLAETEEELRIAMEQRDALKGALRIVEGENGALRSSSQNRSCQTLPPVQEYEIPKKDPTTEEIEMPTPRADAFDHASIFPSSSAAATTEDSPSKFTSTSTSVPLAPALTIPVVTITTPTHVNPLRLLSEYPQGSHWSPVTPITPNSNGSSSPSLSPIPESPVFGDGQSASPSPSPSPSAQFLASQSSSSLELDPVLHRASLTITESNPSEPHTASQPLVTTPPSQPPSHFSSPLSPSSPANQLPERSRSHRWSILSQTPYSRTAIHEELEEAMRRIASMETGEGLGSSSGVGEGEGEIDKSYFEDDEDDGEDGDEDGDGDGDEDEDERFTKVKSEEEVEDMLDLRQPISTRPEVNSDPDSHNPWRS